MTDLDSADNVDVGGTETFDEDIDPGWPWSFILLVVAGAIYLIIRFVDLGIRLLT